MHVNVDMHWRCHGRLHERIGHVVDVKVDDILDKHGHIHKKHVQKLLQNIHMLP
jgi:hypothetical protein